MVQEVRSILFSADECRVAVANWLVARMRDLRAEHIQKVELKPSGGKPSALVTFKLDAQTRQCLDPDELMSAILIYCGHNRIPLSSRAQKRLGLVSGNLALTTSINLRTTAPNVRGSMISHAAHGPDLAMLHTA